MSYLNSVKKRKPSISRFTPRLSFIAIALGQLLGSAYAQSIILDGETSNVDNPVVINTGSVSGELGYAISISNNGKLVVNDSIDLLTAGSSAHGIILNNNSTVDLAQGGTIVTNGTGYGLYSDSGASITSNGPLSITTNGRTIYAVYARDNAEVDLTQGEILTNGINGTGIGALSGGQVTLNNTDITTTNNNSRAVLSTGQNSLVEIDNANISTQGGYTTAYTWGSRGASAESGGTIKLSNSKVNTVGQNGFAVYVTTGGIVELNNIDIETQGSTGYGVRASGAGSIVNSLGHLAINTFGSTAHGVSATLAGVVNLGSGAQINTNGSTSNGINIIAGGGTISGDAVTLTTGGQAANGIYVDTVGAIEGEVAQVTLRGNSIIHTTGETSNGIWGAGPQTLIGIENINIATDGTVSYAINAQRGAKVIATQATLSTLGDNSYGAVANLGGQIDLGTGSVIHTQGEKAYGLWAADEKTQINASDTSIFTSGLGADSVVATQQGRVTLNQHSGQLVSTQGTNFSATGGTIHATLEGSEVRNSGLLISSLADADGHQGYVTLQTRNLSVKGDIFADTTSIADLSMQNVQWTGAATSAGKIDMDSLSRWDLTRSSDVANLSNSGLINFINPIAGDVLVVHGDYVGNNGHIVFNTQLGDDNSLTDKMVIEGSTSGITQVSINNAGGLGAKTLNGIELIQVNGQSDGDFVQSGRIVAGAYDYNLMRGVGSNDANWYLTSTRTPIDSATSSMTERPEAGGYAANLAAANNMFVTRLHDRLGETQYMDALTGEKKVTSMWLRNEGGHNRFRDTQNQLSTQSNRYVLQLGGDIAQWSNDDQNRLHLGIMGGYANSKSRTESRYSGYRARASVDGYSAGIYGTWYANEADKSGWHVDSWAQYSWFNNTVDGQNLTAEAYNSNGVTASIESGYTFKIGENTAKNATYFIQPKAQVTWMGVKADSHKEANGTNVSGEGDGNIQTRLGVKAFMNGYSNQDKGQDRVFQPFVEANWIHNTKKFGANMDGISVKQDGAANIGELKVGVESQINKQVNLWGNVGQQIGNKGYSDTAVMLGAKYNF